MVGEKRRQGDEWKDVVSWEYVGGKVNAIFGSKRSFIDGNKIKILFDINDPIQKYEHDSLVFGLGKRGIEYKTDIKFDQMEGSSLVLASGSAWQLTFIQNDIKPSDFDACLGPLQNFSQQLEGRERRYRSGNRFRKYLSDLTQTPWVSRVPSKYSTDPVLSPTEQLPGLTEDQRREQERLVFKALFPDGMRVGLYVDDWIGEQKRVEQETQSGPETAIPSSVGKSGGEYKRHRRGVLSDVGFLREIRAVFDSGQSASR